MDTSSTKIASLLERVQAGDLQAQGDLIDCIYAELRPIAERLILEAPGLKTLQPTAVVGEALFRLLDQQLLVDVANRRVAFSAAVSAIRRVLVETARRRSVLLGTSGALDALHEAMLVQDIDPIALDLALAELGRRSQRQEEVIMLHFFGGLPAHEIAEQLQVDATTIQDDLRMSKAWLRTQLHPTEQGE